MILLGRYSDQYANNQFRALQQFFKWYATEDPDEPRPNAMANLKPPKLRDKLVPVFTDDEIEALLATCKGGGFRSRRDYAIILMFKDTGVRLSELAGLTTGDVALREREATNSARSSTPITPPARLTATAVSGQNTPWRVCRCYPPDAASGPAARGFSEAGLRKTGI